MSSDTPPAGKPARSAVEAIKENSRGLRGGISAELAQTSDHFSDADRNLLKFHGTYQQEDRDARKTRRAEGLGKHYMFMVRCKMPGGLLTADQYLALDDIAGRHANGTIRFTSRQGVQFHGVLKGDLHATIAGINASLLSTLGACGDVNRNVMACPAPDASGLRAELQAVAARLADHFAPRSGAYHEIWLNGQSTATSTPDEPEPIYGKVYLPRKFKMGLALPEDNCIDVYSQDLGLLAVVVDGRLAGYNVLVGGGMGMTHGNAKTFPQLGRPIGYVPADKVLAAAEAVVRLYRDHGNRTDRKRARIKYLVADWGVQKFRETLATYDGGQLEDPRAVDVTNLELHLGWHSQGDGRWYYGVSVENGRVKDDGVFRLRTALREIVTRFRPEMRVTALQDVLICGLDASARPEIERILTSHGVKLSEQVSEVRRHSLACPAIPTCGLAISESERALPGVLDQLEGVLTGLGLQNERLGVRMTGCPNGCVRPYQSEIGIVGRSGDKYMLFVGGRVQGDRLNFESADLVPRGDLVKRLQPLLQRFKNEKSEGESFGDFCHRLGEEAVKSTMQPTTAV